MTNHEGNSKQICINCKTKLVDFFIFKKRNEEARKIYRDSQYKALILEVTGDQNVALQQNNFQDDNLSENEEEDDSKSITGLFNDGPIFLTFNDSTFISNDESRDMNEIFNEESNEEFLKMPQLFFLKAPLESPEIPEQEINQITKRKLTPENWERTRRKIAKNMGKSYVATNGKIVEAKKMKPDCGIKCRMQCTSRINETTRQKNFDEFYGLAEIELQRKFIIEHIQIFEPKHTKVSDHGKTRSIQRIFFLDGEREGEMVQVCKSMFLNTLVISSQILDTIQFKSLSGNMADFRGRYPRKKY